MKFDITRTDGEDAGVANGIFFLIIGIVAFIILRDIAPKEEVQSPTPTEIVEVVSQEPTSK